MRWFWIDRFVEFTSGQRATAVKNITLAEEYLHDHFPRFPVMPNSLIIEGMAQAGGILVAEYHGFEKRVVLAKIAKALFHDCATPGDTLTYEVQIDDIGDNGAMVSGTSRSCRGLQAEAQLFFAHPDDQAVPLDLFGPEEFLASMRTVRLFEVGRRGDGARLEQHPYFSRDERSQRAADARGGIP